MEDTDSIISTEPAINPELGREEITTFQDWPRLPTKIWEMILGYLERKNINTLIVRALFPKGMKNIYVH